MTKLQKLAEIEGMDSVEAMMEEYGTESCVPGICIHPHCNFTTEVEPDCSDGYCEECESNSVKSFMVLMGII